MYDDPISFTKPGCRMFNFNRNYLLRHLNEVYADIIIAIIIRKHAFPNILAMLYTSANFR